MGKGVQRRWKRAAGFVVLGTLGVLVIALVIVATYAGLVARTVDRRMDQIKHARATQFYAPYPSFRLNQSLSEQELRTLLFDQGYLEAVSDTPLEPRQFRWKKSGDTSVMEIFRPPFQAPGFPLDRLQAKLSFSHEKGSLTITAINRSDTDAPLEAFDNLPQRLGAFYGGRPRTQDTAPLSEIPASARLAIMALEDVHFLDHSGVSLRAILRALLKDLRHMKAKEGGSTLTQQLMKNLYFTSEKSLTRKVKEAFYALVTESRYSKEDILEAYLNEVYLGQAGTHELHGFAEGARFYFNRPISQLSLSQSAMLAAIVQGPGVIHPHKYPDRTLQRRNLALQKMREADFISQDEFDQAAKEPLGVVPKERTLSDVYYALDLVIQRLPEAIRTRMDGEPYTIYASINPYLQSLASKALSENLDRIKAMSMHVTKKEKEGVHLQSALIAVNVKDCTVLALQGGSSYRASQFNRVVQGKRQPGSLFKPFVFLSAFLNYTEATPFSPLTEIDDAPMEWKYEKQSWSPRNYDNKFRGPVTLRHALEMSLNVPTAKLAQSVGIKKVHETILKAGITSEVPVVPSITLGSAAVTPLELAQAYTTFANLGETCELRPYLAVFDENGQQLEETKAVRTPAFPAAATFQVVNILKGVLTHGSAKSTQYAGFPLANFAGKTGTTNDARDAWFVGFSPDFLVLVWVGYDEKEKLGIPGASAALPLWTNFIKNARMFVGPEDFKVPDGLVAVRIDRGVGVTPACTDTTVDYFVAGSEPKSDCALEVTEAPPEPTKPD